MGDTYALLRRVNVPTLVSGILLGNVPGSVLCMQAKGRANVISVRTTKPVLSISVKRTCAQTVVKKKAIWLVSARRAVGKMRRCPVRKSAFRTHARFLGEVATRYITYFFLTPTSSSPSSSLPSL